MNMNKIYFAIAVTAAVAVISVTCGEVTPVEQCPGLQFDNLRDRIHVIPCGKTRCKLRKGTNTTVVFKFTPDKEIKTLTNRVQAEIGALKLPFVGVTGTSACAHLNHADDGTPASCPLAAGREYVYTNVFPIESFYPSASLLVHWGLNDGTRDVVCFEVPAVIN